MARERAETLARGRDGKWLVDEIAEAIEAAVAEEREACAALADKCAETISGEKIAWYEMEKLAEAIRARGKEPAP